MKHLLISAKGLGAAMLGGALGGGAQIVAKGVENPSQVKMAAIAGAVIALMGYFTKSPLPPDKADKGK